MTNKINEISKFNGLWTVEFISTINRFGKGIIILSDKRLLGGDSAYYYSGKYNIKGNELRGNVIIIRHDPIGISVFGDKDSFKLSFSGTIDNLHFSAIASIPEMPQFKLRIIGNKKEDF